MKALVVLAALLVASCLSLDDARRPADSGPSSCTFDAQCDDDNKTTVDSCVKGVCYHDPVGVPWGS